MYFWYKLKGKSHPPIGFGGFFVYLQKIFNQ